MIKCNMAKYCKIIMPVGIRRSDVVSPAVPGQPLLLTVPHPAASSGLLEKSALPVYS
jgi:hypothetical protein